MNDGFEQADFRGRFWIDEGVGVTGVSDEAGRAYLLARLAPALARTGDADRALAYAQRAELEHQPQAWLDVAQVAAGRQREKALVEALTAALALPEFRRCDHLTRIGVALGGAPAVAQRAWNMAVEWARTHPRNEAIEVLPDSRPWPR